MSTRYVLSSFESVALFVQEEMFKKDLFSNKAKYMLSNDYSFIAIFVNSP